MAVAFFDENSVDGFINMTHSYSVNVKSFEYKTLKEFMGNDVGQAHVKCDTYNEAKAVESMMETVIGKVWGYDKVVVFCVVSKTQDVYEVILGKSGSNAWKSYMTRPRVKGKWEAYKE